MWPGIHYIKGADAQDVCSRHMLQHVICSYHSSYSNAFDRVSRSCDKSMLKLTTRTFSVCTYIVCTYIVLIVDDRNRCRYHCISLKRFYLFLSNILQRHLALARSNIYLLPNIIIALFTIPSLRSTFVCTHRLKGCNRFFSRVFGMQPTYRTIDFYLRIHK